MNSPWPMRPDQKRVANFTDGLAGEIEKELNNKDVRIETSAMGNNTGFTISWIYAPDFDDKFYGEVDIVRQSGDSKTLTISVDRGVSHFRDLNKHRYLHEDLIKTAEIYRSVDGFLRRRFGNPMENQSCDVYITQIEEPSDK